MNEIPQTAQQAPRTFQWGISSTDIPFMQDGKVAGARDGCNCNDCSAISPLPLPKRANADRGQEQE